MDFSFFYKKRQGSLLQTLVMCILMASISVMIMKWIMMRYTMSVRLNRSVQSKARAEGVFYNRMSGWNYQNAPADFSNVVDGKTVNGQIRSTNLYGRNVSVVNLRIDEDL